jgi:hypothetical protein
VVASIPGASGPLLGIGPDGSGGPLRLRSALAGRALSGDGLRLFRASSRGSLSFDVDGRRLSPLTSQDLAKC